MKLIIGLIIVFGSVFGGFVLSSGSLMALYQPFEFLIIAGGAFGSFVVANPKTVIVTALKSVPKLLGSSPYNKAMYMDLLTLMYKLFSKARKEGLMALEGDIDVPAESELFKQFPKIVANHHAMDFICDYLRLMVGGNMNAFELENLMDIELQTHHHESTVPSGAVQIVADGLPGFGIVAAVMGVVITMSYISEPPEVLGHHIAAALVGTFLGILLAYGFAGPISKAMEFRAEEEGKFFECIKVCMMSKLNGYTPQVAVEFGRKTIYSHIRPSFTELEQHIKGEK